MNFNKYFQEKEKELSKEKKSNFYMDMEYKSKHWDEINKKAKDTVRNTLISAYYRLMKKTDIDIDNCFDIYNKIISYLHNIRNSDSGLTAADELFNCYYIHILNRLVKYRHELKSSLYKGNKNYKLYNYFLGGRYGVYSIQ